jgi:hypothetical protein
MTINDKHFIHASLWSVFCQSYAGNYHHFVPKLPPVVIVHSCFNKAIKIQSPQFMFFGSYNMSIYRQMDPSVLNQ